MTVEEVGRWSRKDDIAFENALVDHLDESEDDRWEKIAAGVPGKTPDEIKEHYELLMEDINRIESGCVPLPAYTSPDGSNGHDGDEGGRNGKKSSGGDSNHGGKSKLEQERRKGIAWTEDEHRLFLLGLEKYGKGDWRSISRNFVVTRTPTQVASHAQKYFIRLNSMNKDRRRSSIHDITNVGKGDMATAAAASLGPITGQTNNGAAARSTKQAASHPPAGPPMYGGPTIGQPAMGTPVNHHPVAPPLMAYGVHAPPVPGSVVPGAPVTMAPMPYQLPHTPTAHM